MPTLHFQSLVTSLACYICEYLNFPLCSRKPQEKKIALLSVRVFGTAVANVERKLGIPTGGSLTGWQFTLRGRRGELQTNENKCRERIQMLSFIVLFKALLSSPYTSPKASGPIDSQVLKNALARLNQADSLERSFSSSSPELYSPEHRSPERTVASNTLNGSLNGTHRPGLMSSAVR